MYAKIINNEIVKYPYTLEDLKEDFPNTSFPVSLDGLDLSEFNVLKIASTDKPFIDYTKNAIEDIPVNGQQVWKIVDASDKEIEERFKSKEEEIRSVRNEALSQSDWTQLSDSPVNKDAWATYRQELRDITNQEEFPFNTVFPPQPE